MTEVEIKRAVRERDGFACQKCGKHNAAELLETGRSLDVHRTTPGSTYSIEVGVCVTLCRQCHGPEPRRPHGKGDGIRLPARLVEPLMAYIEKFEEEHFIRLTPRQVVNAALKAFLKREGFWPPPPRRSRTP